MGGIDNEALAKTLVSFPRKVNQCMRLMTARYLKDTRIRPHYLVFISTIGCNDGISQKELNEHIAYDKSFVSTVVRELIELGFVTNDGSGKTHSLHLTDSGRDVFAMSGMMFALLDKSLFDALTEEEKEVLSRIMEKIDTRIDEIIAEYSKEDTRPISSVSSKLFINYFE